MHSLARSRIELEQTMAAVQENIQAAAFAPEGCASQFPTTARQHLAELVRFAVKAPEFFAGLGIERRNAVVGCGHVEDTVNHQGSSLEKPRCRSIFLEGRFPVLPLPHNVQTLN